MTEDAIRERHLQNAIVRAAKLLGWLVHHTRPALSQTGRWHTPVQGDVGFPDLVLVYPAQTPEERTAVIFAELKSARGQMNLAQQRWRDALKCADGVEYHLWRPRDWNAIMQRLEQRNRTEATRDDDS